MAGETDGTATSTTASTAELVPQLDWAWVAAAFEAAPLAMAIVDHELVIRRANHPFVERLESEERDLQGQRLGAFVGPAHEEPLHTLLERSTSRVPGRLRTILHTKNGRPLPCEITIAALTPKGALQVQALIMIEFNAEEKRDTEAQSRLSALVNASSDAILSTNPEGFITSWNTGAERMFGYTSEEILWRPIALLVRAENGVPFKDQHQRVLRGGTVRHAEVRCVHHGGGIVDAELSLAPIVNGHGRVAGVSIIARDVTELNRLREETARNRENAIEMGQHAKMVELKTHFLNQAAHELHTPLTPIVIQLHMIRTIQGLPEPLSRSLGVLERNITRLNQLVGNVVLATRLQMEEGKELIVRKPMDLTAVVNHAAATHRAIALQRGIDLQVRAERKLAILGDEGRLTDVLVNFLSNALRFTQPGGMVKIEALEAKDTVIVRVHDQGPGFSHQDLDHLFQPFGRAVVPGVNVADGSGLGLFISRAIIEHHRGRIWAQSDGPGKGAMFCFEVPKSFPV